MLPLTVALVLAPVTSTVANDVFGSGGRVPSSKTLFAIVTESFAWIARASPRNLKPRISPPGSSTVIAVPTPPSMTA